MAALDLLDESPGEGPTPSAGTDPYGDSLFHQAPIWAHNEDPFPVNSRQAARLDRQQAADERRQAVDDRIRAEDLHARGIPTYRNASGGISPVEDETGTALTGFDRTHGIAYDSKGEPKKISYDETGGPKLSDPFDTIPSRIDPKTGAIEKYGPGGLYKYEGQDPTVTAQVAQDEQDKQLSLEYSLLNRKRALDEHNLGQGEQDIKTMGTALTAAVPTLLDPKFEGADRATVLKAIDDHFNQQYAAPEANATAGWFGDELSPEAQAQRKQIDQRKAKAIDAAHLLYDTKDEMGKLSDVVDQTQKAESLRNDTLLAHAMGYKGPLDDQQPATDAAAAAKPAQLYPPESQWPRMLGVEPNAPIEKVANTAEAKGVKLTPMDKIDQPFGADDTRSYRIGEDKSFHLDPNNMLKGLRQGVDDGLIDPAKAKELSPQLSDVQNALNEQKKVIDDAGGLSKVKALTHGAGMGAAFLIGSGPGAEYGGELGAALAPESLGISIPVGAILGGLIGGTITSLGAKKLVAKLAESNDTIRSFTAAAELHPYYDTAGNLLTFGTGIPTKLAQAGVNLAEKSGSTIAESIANSYLRSSGGLYSTVENLAKDAAIRKAGGASTATIAAALTARVAGAAATNVAIDTAINEGSRALGLQKEGETLPSATQAALIGAFMAGHGLTFKQYEPSEMANILVRAKQAMNAGKDLTTVLHPNEVEAFNAFSTELRRKINTGEIPIDADAVAGTVRQALQGGKAYGVSAADIAGRGGKPGLGDPTAPTPPKAGPTGPVTPEPPEKPADVTEIPVEPKPAAPVTETPKAPAPTEPKPVIESPKTEPPQEITTKAPGAASDTSPPVLAKGTHEIDGVKVQIQHESGETRKEGHQPLQTHYGSLPGVKGADGDNVDAVVTPGTTADHKGPAFVLDQNTNEGALDEHKLVFGKGVTDEKTARAAYRSNFPSHIQLDGNIRKFDSLPEAKQWLSENSADKTPVGVLEKFPNKAEGTVAYVSKHEKGFSVTLKDTDSGKMVPSAEIHPTIEAAREAAKKAANIDQPKIAEKPPSTTENPPETPEKGGKLQVRTPDGRMTEMPQHVVQTEGEHVLSTAAKVDGALLVGRHWNEGHDAIGVRHGIDDVPQSSRGFIVQRADGKQEFVDRKEALRVAGAAGQLQPGVPRAGQDALQSADLKKVDEKPKKSQTVTNAPVEETPSPAGTPESGEATGEGGKLLLERAKSAAAALGETHARVPENTRFQPLPVKEVPRSTFENANGELIGAGVALTRLKTADGSLGPITFLYNPDVLVEQLLYYPEPDAVQQTWVNEEHIHARDREVSGHAFVPNAEAIFAEFAADPAADAALKAISLQSEPWALGAELTRMVYQLRNTGEISEVYTAEDDFPKILPFLNKTQGPILEAHLARMVALPKGGTPDVTPETPEPAPTAPETPKTEVAPPVTEKGYTVPRTPHGVSPAEVAKGAAQNMIQGAGERAHQTLRLADGTEVPFTYSLVDGRLVVDNPENEQPGPDHPDTQEFVAKNSGKAYDERKSFVDDPDFQKGPPVAELREERVVLDGGHRRTYLYRANKEAYNAGLIRNADKFGIEPTLVNSMIESGGEPYLVALLDDELEPAQRTGLIRQLNTVDRQATNPVYDAVSAGRVLTLDSVDEAGTLFEGAHNSTPLAALKTASAKALSDAFLRDGAIRATDAKKYIEPNGAFTDEGAKFARYALLGRVLDSPSTLAGLDGTPAETKLLNAIGQLHILERRGQDMRVFRDMLELEHSRLESGENLKRFQDLLDQDFLVQRNPKADALHRWFDSFNSRDARAAFNKLINDFAPLEKGANSLLDEKNVDVGEALLAREQGDKLMARSKESKLTGEEKVYRMLRQKQERGVALTPAEHDRMLAIELSLGQKMLVPIEPRKPEDLELFAPKAEPPAAPVGPKRIQTGGQADLDMPVQAFDKTGQGTLFAQAAKNLTEKRGGQVSEADLDQLRKSNLSRLALAAMPERPDHKMSPREFHVAITKYRSDLEKWAAMLPKGTPLAFRDPERPDVIHLVTKDTYPEKQGGDRWRVSWFRDFGDTGEPPRRAWNGQILSGWTPSGHDTFDSLGKALSTAASGKQLTDVSFARAKKTGPNDIVLPGLEQEGEIHWGPGEDGGTWVGKTRDGFAYSILQDPQINGYIAYFQENILGRPEPTLKLAKRVAESHLAAKRADDKNKPIRRESYKLEGPKALAAGSQTEMTLRPARKELPPGFKPMPVSLLTTRPTLTQKSKTNYLTPKMQQILKPHQARGVNLAVDTLRGGLGFLNADGTGAGKTMQEIAVASIMAKGDGPEPVKQRVLIVTENDTIIQNAFAKDSEILGEEMWRYMGDEVVPGRVYGATYNNLRSGLVQPGDFDTVIFDEAHNLRNILEDTAQAKAGRNLALGAQHVMYASATPLDKPQQIAYLRPILGDNIEHYFHDLGIVMEQRENKKTGEITVTYKTSDAITDAQQQAVMDRILEEITRRGQMIKRDVPLNNVSVEFKEVKISDEAYDHADDLYDRILNEMKEKSAYNAGGVAGMTVRGYLETQKIDAAMDDALKAIKDGKQVIIFADRIKEGEEGKYTEGIEGTLNELVRHLEAKLGKGQVGKVFGGDKPRSQRDISRFQNSDIHVIVATPKSGGTGINLDDIYGDTPRHLIVMTAPMSGLDLVQIIGRINRLTTLSKGTATVLFVEHPVDTWNLDIGANKLHLLSAAVSGDLQKIRPLEGRTEEIHLNDDVTLLASEQKIGEEEARAKLTSDNPKISGPAKALVKEARERINNEAIEARRSATNMSEEEMVKYADDPAAFSALSPGHALLQTALQNYIADGSLASTHAELIRAVFSQAKGDFLNRIVFSSDKGMGSLGRGGRDAEGNPIVKLKEGQSPNKHRRVASDMGKVFMHEYGHAGYFVLLTPAERRLVNRIYARIGGRAGAAEYFGSVSPQPAQSNRRYYAKNVYEFFAQGFAEYVFEKRVPSNLLKRMYDRLLSILKKFYDALRRRSETHMETLKPLFDKILDLKENAKNIDFSYPDRESLLTKPQGFTKGEVTTATATQGGEKGFTAKVSTEGRAGRSLGWLERYYRRKAEVYRSLATDEPISMARAKREEPTTVVSGRYSSMPSTLDAVNLTEVPADVRPLAKRMREIFNSDRGDKNIGFLKQDLQKMWTALRNWPLSIPITEFSSRYENDFGGHAINLELTPEERTAAKQSLLNISTANGMLNLRLSRKSQTPLFSKHEEGEISVALGKLLAADSLPPPAQIYRPAEQSGQMTLFAQGPKVQTFKSGANTDQLIDAYRNVGDNIGVELGDLKPRRMVKLTDYVNSGKGQVFVDSGAFGAFQKGETLDFDKVMTDYRRLTDSVDRPYRGNLSLVMPDVVGDSAATMALVDKHRDSIVGLIKDGVRVVMPMQQGAPLAETMAKYAEILGTDSFVPGIPSKAAAFPKNEVIQFVRAQKPREIHLLGLNDNPKNSSYLKILTLASPSTRVTVDGTWHRAKVGEGRPITETRRNILADKADDTEMTASLFLDGWEPEGKHMKALAKVFGSTPEELQKAARAGQLGEKLTELSYGDENLVHLRIKQFDDTITALDHGPEATREAIEHVARDPQDVTASEDENQGTLFARPKWMKAFMPFIDAGRRVKEGAQELVLPSAVSEEHLEAADGLRARLGPMHRRDEVGHALLTPYRRAMDRLGVEKEGPLQKNPGIQFMSNMSTGTPQATPELQKGEALAEKLLAEHVRDLARADAPLSRVRENYFPGMWTRDSVRAFNQAIEEMLPNLPPNWSVDTATPAEKKAIADRVNVLLENGLGSDKDMLRYLARRPLKGAESFRKQKVFDDIMEAIDFGLRPISNNPFTLIELKLAEMSKSIMAHEYFSDLKDNGQLKVIPPLSPPPDGWVKIPDKYGVVIAPPKPGEYGLHIVGQRVVPKEVGDVLNNYLSSSLYNNQYFGTLYKGWMGLANLLNQTQLGVGSAFHAGFTTVEAQISGVANLLKDVFGVMRGNRSVGQLFKSVGMASVATVETARTGDKVLNAWLDPNGTMDPRIRQVVRAAELAGAGFKMEKGLVTSQLQKQYADWFSGHRVRAAMRSPVAFVELMAKPIMEMLVPRQKAGVFAHMVWRIIEQNPGVPLQDLAPQFSAAWNRIDARLGQVRYDRLFMNNVAKNIVQALIRAPGWSGGTIAELAGGFKDTAKFFTEWAKTGSVPKDIPDRVAYTIALLLTVGTLNAVLTALFTGQRPQGNDFVAFRTGREDESGNPERFTLPSYLKDVYAYWKDGGGTLLHKTHPLLSLFGELLTNKDYYNVQIRDENASVAKQALQSGEHFIKAFQPFWIKGVQKSVERGAGLPERILPLVGVMPAPRTMNQSPAVAAAEKYWSGTRTEAGVEPAQFERQATKRQLVKEIRSGKTPDISAALQKGVLKPTDIKPLYKRAQQGAFASMVSHMPLAEAEKVYKLASPAEKAQIEGMIAQKRTGGRTGRRKAMFTGF